MEPESHSEGDNDAFAGRASQPATPSGREAQPGDAAVSPPPAPMGNTGIQTSVYAPMGMVGVDSLIATIEGEKKGTFCEWSARIAEAVESRRCGNALANVAMMGATLFPRAV